MFYTDCLCDIMKNFKIVSVFSYVAKKRFSTVAGAWVFYFLLALLPMVFLFITALNFFGLDAGDAVVSRLPEELKEIGDALVTAAQGASGSVTVFFVVSVVFSCSTFVTQMIKDGEYLYGKVRQGRRGLFRRLISLGAVAVIFLSFLWSACAFAFGGKITIGGEVRQINFPRVFLLFTLVIVTCYVIIIALNGFVCPIKTSAANFLIGSLVSLAVIAAGTVALILYLKFFKFYNVFYGGLAGVLIFLVWSYVVMCGLVAGVCVNAFNVNKYRRV